MEEHNNYSHFLNIIIINPPSNEVEELIQKEIQTIIENKTLTYLYNDFMIKIKWKKLYKKGEYYTDVEGILGDVAVQKHKELMLKDILGKLNKKFGHIFATGESMIIFRVTRPLTRKITLD